MLTALAIRDVVLIEALDLDFGAGLDVLTGETGAGKSILLDALGLALARVAKRRLSATAPRKRSSPQPSIPRRRRSLRCSMRTASSANPANRC